MGKGADVASKYAVGEHDPEAAKKVKKAETTHDDDDSAAKPETQNVPPRPSTAELQLVVDYSTAEEEKDIGDPHRSAVIIPGFAVSNADNGAMCPRAFLLCHCGFIPAVMLRDCCHSGLAVRLLWYCYGIAV